jgi:hypothetical protein
LTFNIFEPGTWNRTWNLEPGTEPGTWNLRTCERFNNPPPNLKSDSSAKKMLRKMGVQDSFQFFFHCFTALREIKELFLQFNNPGFLDGARKINRAPSVEVTSQSA